MNDAEKIRQRLQYKRPDVKAERPTKAVDGGKDRDNAISKGKKAPKA